MTPPATPPASLVRQGCIVTEPSRKYRTDAKDPAGKEISSLSSSSSGSGGLLLESDRDTTLPTISRISDWQARTLADDAIKETGIVAQLTQACIDFFSALLHPPTRLDSLTRKASNKLRRNFSTLVLWADGHDVLNGRLDHVLEKSKSLQHTILTILFSLSGTLSTRLSKVVMAQSEDARRSLLRNTNIHMLREQTRCILSEQDQPVHVDSDFDSSSDEECGDRIESTIEDVKAYTQCLVDLSETLECPASDPEYEERTPTMRLEKRNAHDYFADLVIAKFPKASLDLAECLGKANWQRYQRMQAERVNNAISAEVTDEELARSKAVSSEFQDSGIGTSLPAQLSSYAPTTISFVSSFSSGQRIPIPPLPAEAQDGHAFECVACSKSVHATTNREWRKHLFKDLQPYTCFYPECQFSATPFHDRQVWSTHLELDHELGPDWESKECPLCLEPTGNGKGTVLIHFARHMEDIAIAVLPRNFGDEEDLDIDFPHFHNSQSEELSPVVDQPKDWPITGTSSGVIHRVFETENPLFDPEAYMTPRDKSTGAQVLKEGWDPVKWNYKLPMAASFDSSENVKFEAIIQQSHDFSSSTGKPPKDGGSGFGSLASQSTPGRYRQSPSHDSARGRESGLAKSLIEREYPSDTDRARSVSPPDDVHSKEKKSTSNTLDMKLDSGNLHDHPMCSDVRPGSTASEVHSYSDFSAVHDEDVVAKSNKKEDYRLEINRLRWENEEKEIRLRQLEAAVTALQQRRRRDVTPIAVEKDHETIDREEGSENC